MQIKLIGNDLGKTTFDTRRTSSDEPCAHVGDTYSGEGCRPFFESC